MAVEHVCRTAPFDPEDPELGYTYTFPAIDLTLWRPVMAESEDDQEGRTFESVGVGRRGHIAER